MGKLVYAKRICLMTVALLTMNLLFASFSFSSTQSHSSKDRFAKISLLSESEQDNLVFENESLEEEEEELIVHASDFEHFYEFVFSKQVLFRNKQLYFENHHSAIPRWLMVRHILI